MTTKKSPAAAKKATVKKTATTAKKASTQKASSKGAVALAESVAEATVTEKLVSTMMPETPTVEVTMEAAVAAAEVKSPVAATPEAKTYVLTIGMFQKRLSELGLYDGPWDGVYGPLTKHAAARFQAGKGLKVNGDANAETLLALGLDLYKTY